MLSIIGSKPLTGQQENVEMKRVCTFFILYFIIITTIIVTLVIINFFISIYSYNSSGCISIFTLSTYH